MTTEKPQNLCSVHCSWVHLSLKSRVSIDWKTIRFVTKNTLFCSTVFRFPLYFKLFTGYIQQKWVYGNRSSQNDDAQISTIRQVNISVTLSRFVETFLALVTQSTNLYRILSRFQITEKAKNVDLKHVFYIFFSGPHCKSPQKILFNVLGVLSVFLAKHQKMQFVLET